MKKAKKTIGLFTTIVIVIVNALFSANIQAQDGAVPGSSINTNINPLNVARAFALETPAYFVGGLHGNILVSNTYQRIEMHFVVRKSDFAITNLTINGVPIPLPKPIFSLPMGEGGFIQSASFGVSAMTRSGKFAGYGNTYREIIRQNDIVTIVVSPRGVEIDIPIDTRVVGDEVDLIIEGFPYGYGWGTRDGRLFAHLPPIGGVYRFMVKRRSDGAIIGSGFIEPYKAVVLEENIYFGIQYIGNVIEMEFPEPGIGTWKGTSIRFDCSIPTTGGTNVMGKVVFTDVDSGGLEIQTGSDVWVYVQKVTTSGDMPFLALEDRRNPNCAYGTHVSTERNIGKVVITIIPKRAEESNNRIWLSLRRYYTSPSIQSCGDGKG